MGDGNGGSMAIRKTVAIANDRVIREVRSIKHDIALDVYQSNVLLAAVDWHAVVSALAIEERDGSIALHVDIYQGRGRTMPFDPDALKCDI